MGSNTGFSIPLLQGVQASLEAFRTANQTSSLPEDWKGPLHRWKGLKVEEGALAEL